MQEWLRIFPELDWIEDEELRGKVAGVWDASCRRGGWTIDAVASIPFTLLISAGGVSLVDHTRLVTSLSREIGRTMKEVGGYSINDDYLIAGALLHDVGKLLEYRREGREFEVSRSGKMLRHPLSGMGMAVLGDIPEDICHIIAVHSREGEKSYRSPEAVILHHADFIAFETIKSIAAAP